MKCRGTHILSPDLRVALRLPGGDGDPGTLGEEVLAIADGQIFKRLDRTHRCWRAQAESLSQARYVEVSLQHDFQQMIVVAYPRHISAC